MKVLVVLVVFVVVLLVLAVIVTAIRESARARPLRELDEAKRILTQIQIHDDLVPSIPEVVRGDVDEFLQTKHRRK